MKGRPPQNTLREKYPDIDAHWCFERNGNLTPDSVGSRSGKIVWWSCPHNPSHAHQARVVDKTLTFDRWQKWGCPFCSGRRIGSPKESLASKRPDLAAEWHPTMNGDVTPEMIPPATNTSYWWLCERNHAYQMQPKDRHLRDRGCPECSSYGYGSSQEIRIYCELKVLFSDIKFRHRIEGKEIDIFLPQIGIGIEYDGAIYHQNLIDEDLAKNALMASLGLHLIRVRERPLEPISDLDVITPTRRLSKNDVDHLLKSILKAVPSTGTIISPYLSRNDFINQDDYAEYISYSDRPIPENSLAEKFPDLALQWDHEKNAPLTPYDFSHGSKHRVWWICENGHSFDSVINARTSHFNSPYKGCKTCWMERKLPLGDKQKGLFEEGK